MKKFRNYLFVLSGLAAIALSVSCQHSKPVLTPVNTVTIPACSGEAIIYNAQETFSSYRDFDFQDWGLNKSGEATEQTSVQIYEMTQNADFATMFGSLGANLDKLCLTQAQVISFCEKFPSELSQPSFTFFLIKENGKYFVVRVRVNFNGLHADVYQFGNGSVWGAEGRHRVVSPRLVD